MADLRQSILVAHRRVHVPKRDARRRADFGADSLTLMKRRILVVQATAIGSLEPLCGLH
jgi:hypothetical protein